ncbi:putative membrane-anchored protein [Sphingomonas kaistensis]|uniref:Putative membrane-anchored protein n=1 Tax=Sphingomonas kaistensis TaxID=298708 RepID=A0A7X5Y8N0_9SPHN|nr:DUF3422 domain-containing protein [Sphingomonas kaistensis]NJC05531.1 putative membrane-anchored protein [Sphingomonas kaistensis]
MDFHPQRDSLLAEVHARPSTPISAPMLVTRIAALSGPEGAAADRRHISDLCKRIGAPRAADDAVWCAVDGGDWQLRWEKHGEFSSWTFLASPDGTPEESAIAAVPRAWLDSLPGQVVVLTTLVIAREERRETVPDPKEKVGSRIMGETATVLTDLRADAGGMTRFRLFMHVDDPVLTGRIALSLLEIESYRLMALLAFPVAQQTAAKLAEIEAEARELTEKIATHLGVDDDRDLLARLVALSGRMEAMSASTSFRFGAARAYYDLVQARIASLGEEALAGRQTMRDFMDRRLGPAMRTCLSIAQREAEMISRIARAGQMLSTRVELVTQKINADLLESMNRRASMQLRLQRTVEGLSVAAVSYYVVSLLLIPLKALDERVHVDTALLTLLLVPLVVAGVWWTLRRVSGRIDDD